MRPAPLHALHAFESAARLLSYSRAAEELHVTHSAVSQQIRGLEVSLGVTLFERQGRQMLLTREGALLYRRIQPALRQIGSAVDEVATLQRAPSITVATLQSFANRWLLARIGRFQKTHPDIVIHIHGSTGLTDLERGEADIAIRYGRGSWKGCESEKLMDEWLFPVCSPSFNNGRLPKTPAGLKRYRILRDDCQGEWNAWAGEAGIDLDGCRHETGYSDSNLMLGAAIEGQGIAIGRSALVSTDLAAGRLVRMFDLIVPAPLSYYLVTAAGRAKPPHLQAFEAWLREETASFERKDRKRLGV